MFGLLMAGKSCTFAGFVNLKRMKTNENGSEQVQGLLTGCNRADDTVTQRLRANLPHTPHSRFSIHRDADFAVAQFDRITSGAGAPANESPPAQPRTSRSPSCATYNGRSRSPGRGDSSAQRCHVQRTNSPAQPWDSLAQLCHVQRTNSPAQPWRLARPAVPRTADELAHPAADVSLAQLCYVQRTISLTRPWRLARPAVGLARPVVPRTTDDLAHPAVETRPPSGGAPAQLCHVQRTISLTRPWRLVRPAVERPPSCATYNGRSRSPGRGDSSAQRWSARPAVPRTTDELARPAVETRPPSCATYSGRSRPPSRGHLARCARRSPRFACRIRRSFWMI
ncbi:hypothetical protein IJ21_43740 [Paenibacillus sp. 32O-W]|nr:hypothetical protein IJ21_43740 [Paenibacillus sp. 32O-W]